MSGAGVKYKAKYDFTATQGSTLGFKAGDVFVFISKSSEDWWSVKTVNGQMGLVPATYLEELKEPSTAKESVPVNYRALYDYTGANSSQLTFRQGDMMVLLDMPSSGWWSMRHTASGKQGLVPTNYVEKAVAASSNGTSSHSGAGAGGGEPNLKDENVLAEVLLSIDRAIEAIHVETTKAGGVVSAQQRAALTRLLLHRQQTIASSKQEPKEEHAPLAYAGTREVSPSAVLVTPTLPTLPTPQPNLPTSTSSSGGRQSMYIPSHESGDLGDAGDQQRQRSSTLPRRQAPPPPKRDERYTLSTASSPSSSRGVSPSSSSDQSTAAHPITVKAQSGPSLTTPASPSRGGTMVSPSSPLLAKRSAADQSKPSLSEGGKGGGGGGGGEIVAAMLSSFCDDLTISMEEEIKSLDMPESPFHSAPGSPFRARTLSNPRSSPSRNRSNPVAAEPLLPPVPGVNEAAVAMPTATPPLAVSTTSSSTVTGVVAAAVTPVTTPSATPSTTTVSSSAVASTEPPAPVLAPPPPSLRTQFTDQEAGELVEVVRVGTGMSYKNTLIAVNGVLDFLKAKVPECSDMVEGLLRAMHSSQTGVSTARGDQLVSKDMERLRDAFFQIKDCKDDTQQRGWAVHDDHHIISGYLSELLLLLCDADPDISRRVVKEDKYENILTLIEFYHLEPRVPLRLLMLKIFAALCELDQTVIGILLSSVLPNELGRDMQQGISETEKVVYSSTVCTIIFSTGEAVPLSVYDQWNQDYILFLLDTIEQPPSSDRQELLPDAFMNIILAYNQHFQDPASNIVMSALKMRPNPKAFSEKLMMLVNRGEDPVAGHCEPNALLKVMLDMFSDKATSSIFYTTDLMVLIDIIHRQLSDMEAGSKTRTHYLELLYRVLSTTEYTEHNRRQRELTTCLSRIAREDLEESERDRELVARIHAKFPMLFEESTVI